MIEETLYHQWPVAIIPAYSIIVDAAVSISSRQWRDLASRFLAMPNKIGG
jgi:hypothetical protein